MSHQIVAGQSVRTVDLFLDGPQFPLQDHHLFRVRHDLFLVVDFVHRLVQDGELLFEFGGALVELFVVHLGYTCCKPRFTNTQRLDGMESIRLNARVAAEELTDKPKGKTVPISFRAPEDVDHMLTEASLAAGANVTELILACVRRALPDVVRELDSERAKRTKEFLSRKK